MSGKLLYIRKFLNTEEEGGAAYVEATVGELEASSKGDLHMSAQLSISDCNRVITLDFDVWGKERVPELRAKIGRLRQAVVAFEKVLLEQYKNIEL